MGSSRRVPAGAERVGRLEGFVAPRRPRAGPVAASVVLRLEELTSCRGRKRSAGAEEGGLLGRKICILLGAYARRRLVDTRAEAYCRRVR